MNALKWITAEAKRIKKRYPTRFKKWTQYVAQASAIYASKHKGKSPVGHKHKKISGMTKKKKTHRRVSRKKTVRRIKRLHAAEGRAIRRLHGVGSIPTLKRKLVDQYKNQLASGMLSQYQAKTKRVKRKIGKRLTEIKRKLRQLQR